MPLTEICQRKGLQYVYFVNCGIFIFPRLYNGWFFWQAHQGRRLRDMSYSPSLYTSGSRHHANGAYTKKKPSEELIKKVLYQNRFSCVQQIAHYEKITFNLVYSS